MDYLYLFLFYCGWFVVLIAVHEFGHYLAGLVAGIPAREMRIRMLAFPQHVILRDGEQWVSPVQQIDRYVELVRQHLKTPPRVFLYTAGGILLETLFTTIVGVSLLVFGESRLALVLVAFSLFLLLPWILIDTVAVLRGRIVGDLSGLWALAPISTVILVGICLSARGVIMWQAVA